nr:hypothetical protein CFP56_07627 [Quercus suber]
MQMGVFRHYFQSVMTGAMRRMSERAGGTFSSPICRCNMQDRWSPASIVSYTLCCGWICTRISTAVNDLITSVRLLSNTHRALRWGQTGTVDPRYTPRVFVDRLYVVIAAQCGILVEDDKCLRTHLMPGPLESHGHNPSWEILLHIC